MTSDILEDPYVKKENLKTKVSLSSFLEKGVAGRWLLVKGEETGGCGGRGW
jgi:hypothetical protein